jgi:hypothetical protein
MRYFVIVAVLMAVSSPATTIVDTDPDRIEFVIGNVVFVTLHEFSHLIIEDFGIPILGNGEDAADTLAAVSLIQLDRTSPARDFRFIGMLLSAADANRIIWQRGLEKNNPIAYALRHPLSVQRAARINCLAYGSDPELLELLPELVELPLFRADWCVEEFNDAEKAWTWVLDSYVRNSDVRKNNDTIRHKFAYGEADEPRHIAVRQWLQEEKVLERILDHVVRTIVLPEAFTLRTRSCGSPDAYWDRDRRELVVCYQLIDAFYELSAEQGIKDMKQTIRKFLRENNNNDN